MTALTAQDVQLQQAAVASDEKGAVLRAQAVAYMKDKWGLEHSGAGGRECRTDPVRRIFESDVEERRLETEEQVKECHTQ